MSSQRGSPLKPSQRLGATENVLQTQAFDRPGRILIIDDDPGLRGVLAFHLERHLHDVLQAEGGAQGLQLARTEAPDLIILDVGLPDISGFDLCKKLKTDPVLQYIPVLILTGHNDPETQVKSLDAGANDFISKPANLAVTIARVRSLLKYRRAVAALKVVQEELEQRVQARTEELSRAVAELKKQIGDLNQEKSDILNVKDKQIRELKQDLYNLQMQIEEAKQRKGLFR